MAKRITDEEMIGKRFNKLVVLERGSPRGYRSTWVCRCDCGTVKEISQYHLRSKINPTKSCGCLLKAYSKKNNSPIRKARCEICNTEFEYQSILRKKTCSDECHVVWTNRQLIIRRKYTIHTYMRTLLYGVRDRCKKKNIPIDIDYDFLMNLYTTQDGKCLKTGNKLVISTPGCGNKRLPNAISIDRIDSNKGYTRGNVQLVCIMYNFAKNNWADDDVLKMAYAIVEQDQLKKQQNLPKAA